MIKPIYFATALIMILTVAVIYLAFDSGRHQTEKEALQRDAKLREKLIQGLRIKEVNQAKHIAKLLADYDDLKDSLAVERANVKIKYIRYEKPVKVDLSTDHKRDSVINAIIR